MVRTRDGGAHRPTEWSSPSGSGRHRRTQCPWREELAGGERRLQRRPPPVRPPGRHGPGQPEQIERHEVSWPLLRCPGSSATTPGKPVLQPLAGEAPCDIPYEQLTVHRGRIRQLPAPATTSGNASLNSMPRLECSTTWPASTKTAARKPSHLGSPGQPDRIGSGSAHVTPHPIHVYESCCCRSSRKQRSRTPGSPGSWVARSTGATAHPVASSSWTANPVRSLAAAISTTARPCLATWTSLICLMPGTMSPRPGTL